MCTRDVVAQERSEKGKSRLVATTHVKYNATTHVKPIKYNTTKYALRYMYTRGTYTTSLIPGRTEDGPGIDCLTMRMRHIIPRNWGLWITSYMLSKTMTSQGTEVD